MLLLGTREFAQSVRKQGQLHNGMQYWRNDFFKSSDDDVCTPQCYLVEQFPDSVNPTHFHVQNQFQLFTRGEGTIGRSPKPLRAFTVHYAGAYTGYGPIVAGPEGVDYITMRAFRDPGAKFVPQQRELMRVGPKRHWASEALMPMDAGELAALQAPRVEVEMINTPGDVAWGAGEPTPTAVPAAVANAIYDATGARLRSIPITPEKVKAALATVKA